MDYEPKTYFTEHEYDDVKGFSILDRQNGEYHIAEKWLRSDEEQSDLWLDYWVPEADLNDRVESDDCEPKATLTDEQYEQVCDKVGWHPDKLADGATA